MMPRKSMASIDRFTEGFIQTSALGARFRRTSTERDETNIHTIIIMATGARANAPPELVLAATEPVVEVGLHPVYVIWIAAAEDLHRPPVLLQVPLPSQAICQRWLEITSKMGIACGTRLTQRSQTWPSLPAAGARRRGCRSRRARCSRSQPPCRPSALAQRPSCTSRL